MNTNLMGEARAYMVEVLSRKAELIAEIEAVKRDEAALGKRCDEFTERVRRWTHDVTRLCADVVNRVDARASSTADELWAEHDALEALKDTLTREGEELTRRRQEWNAHVDAFEAWALEQAGVLDASCAIEGVSIRPHALEREIEGAPSC
ncbi:MAG: hypothetical protein JXO72_14905 [Vicinamibacteria bacterium]|nr:hypothetical protein [Vicinamibacteria bacterium]